MKALFEVTLFITKNNRHTDFITSGFLKLAELQKIRLEIKPLYPKRKNRTIVIPPKHIYQESKGYPWTIEAEIKDLYNNKKCRVGFDLQDWHEMLSTNSLDKCDLIFKRSFNQGVADFILENTGIQILPLGPNFRIALKLPFIVKIKFKVELISRIWEVINHPSVFFRKGLNKILKNNSISQDFKPNQVDIKRLPPDEPYIFFQVQLHDLNNKRGKKLNQNRVELIRSFKKRFGNQFIGGVFSKVPLPPDYDDVLTDISSSPDTYRLFCEKATVAISTNGFGDSIPWKLIEYMQWGCSILSEQPVHPFRMLPDDDTIAFFKSTEQALDLAEKLLKDKNKTSLMRHNALAFYDNHLKPEKAVLEMLEEAKTFENIWR